MPITVSCPSCASKLKAPDHLAGRTLACPRCKTPVAVPSSAHPGPAPRQAIKPPPPVPRPPAELVVEVVPGADAVAVPAAPPYKPCPFCSEQIRADARRCKHCGETLDPALRAAEEERRDTDRRQARRHDPPPRKRRGLLGKLVILLLCVGVVAFTVMFLRQREALHEAGRLWDAGRRDEAVALYKQGYPAAASEKGPVLRRIVEHELAKGNAAEAAKWVRRGVDDGLDVAYDSPAARDLAARERQDRDARAAAKRKDDEDARAHAAKGGSSSGLAKRQTRVTRVNYDRIEEGMTYEEVQEILGPGKEVSRAGDLVVVNWEGGVLGLRVITVTFEGGRVTAKGILD